MVEGRRVYRVLGGDKEAEVGQPGGRGLLTWCPMWRGVLWEVCVAFFLRGRGFPEGGTPVI